MDKHLKARQEAAEANEKARKYILELLKVAIHDAEDYPELVKKFNSVRKEVKEDQEISFSKYAKDILRLVHNNGYIVGRE